MALQPSGKPSSLLRLTLSGLLALETAIVANLAIGLVSTQPKIPFQQAAVAAEDVGSRVFELTSSAVVAIETKDGSGSGSIIRSSGLVLTNAHVVDGEKSVTVVLKDGRKYKADVVAFGEHCLDLALVQIREQVNLPSIQIAKAQSVRVGQQVFALGNPFDLQNSLTAGIVSRIDTTQGRIQTDAAINPGNSGGPLLNSDGAMIGVNYARLNTNGIGFAIPTDRVLGFLQTFDQGKAPRSYQGVLPGTQRSRVISLSNTRLNGRLSKDTNVLCRDGSFFDEYKLPGKAGQLVRIYLRSRDFTPYLALLGPNGKRVALDDNRQNDDFAVVVTRLPEDGTYRIIANSRKGGESGDYRLELTPLILHRYDELRPGDPVQKDGTLYRDYLFQGQAGQSVNIYLYSKEMDTRIFLYGPNGQLITQNDDIPLQSGKPAIRLTLRQTGSYRVVVNAALRRGQGRYILSIE